VRFHTAGEVSCLRLTCYVRRYKHGNQSKSLDMLQLLLLDYIAVLHKQMTRIVNDWVEWSGLSPSEPCRKFGSVRDTVCVQDSGGPRKRPIAYSEPLRANTVLCSFNTIQPFSWLVFIRYDARDRNEKLTRWELRTMLCPLLNRCSVPGPRWGLGLPDPRYRLALRALHELPHYCYEVYVWQSIWS